MVFKFNATSHGTPLETQPLLTEVATHHLR